MGSRPSRRHRFDDVAAVGGGACRNSERGPLMARRSLVKKVLLSRVTDLDKLVLICVAEGLVDVNAISSALVWPTTKTDRSIAELMRRGLLERDPDMDLGQQPAVILVEDAL